MNTIILLVLLTTFVQITRSDNHAYDYLEEEDTNTLWNTLANTCPETEEYEDTITIPYNHTFTVSFTTWCLSSFSLRCTKFRNETKVLFKTVSVLKTRTTVNCCPGYKNLYGTCIAICNGVCVNGKCKKPYECDCDLGWKGENCTEECGVGWFGKNCGLPCNCNNGATCDRFNGICYCQPGFTGMYCEVSRHDKNSSKECIGKECQCQNGGNFSESDGICQCLPGYFGNYCEKPCKFGTFGKNCSSICSCQTGNTEMCNPIDGKCHCLPGWDGDVCDKPCELGSWGWNCEHRCSCGPNGTCNPVTGLCFCPPGWHGINCEKTCPPGYYAQDCKIRCPDCKHAPGLCHHETGWCKCPPGVTGQLCDLECPTGKYGQDCKDFCLCNNNSTCDSITGKCYCQPGWQGKECSLPCPDGSFGANCSFSCNCLNGATCNNTDGVCINQVKILQEVFVKDLFHEEYTYLPFGLQILYGILIFILVALVISFVWFKIKEKSYVSNIHQAVRARLKRQQWFKNAEEEKEDTSVTNVCQEDSTSVTQISQFANPLYESPKGCENNTSRPTSTAHSINKENHTEPMRDEFDDLPFMIPESNAANGYPISRPDVKISFGRALQECDTNPHPVINYSSTDKTFYFVQTERNSALANDADINVHRYENIDETKQVQITKE